MIFNFRKQLSLFVCVDNREDVSLPESQMLEDVLCSSDVRLRRKRQSSKGVCTFQPLGRTHWSLVAGASQTAAFASE